MLRWASISALLGTISPVVNSITMALRLRRENIIYLAIGFCLKFVTFFPLIFFTGYPGAITSSAICSITIMTLDLLAINRRYHVDYKPTLRKLCGMGLGLLAMWLSFVLLRLLGLHVCDQPRLIATVELGIYGLSGLVLYVAVTSYFKVPERIFHLDPSQNIWKSLMGILLRRK